MKILGIEKLQYGKTKKLKKWQKLKSEKLKVNN